jgi:putative endonuclease
MPINNISKNNQVGRTGELLAQQLYIKRGFRIVEQNFFNRRGKRVGEIDFVAESHKSIVFVEVKTRTGPLAGGIESVTGHKQRKLLAAVQCYLAGHRQFAHLSPRIDVCALQLGLDNTIKNVIIIPNAVEGGHRFRATDLVS